jgi:hypothetical protein
MYPATFTFPHHRQLGGRCGLAPPIVRAWTSPSAPGFGSCCPPRRLHLPLPALSALAVAPRSSFVTTRRVASPLALPPVALVDSNLTTLLVVPGRSTPCGPVRSTPTGAGLGSCCPGRSTLRPVPPLPAAPCSSLDTTLRVCVLCPGVQPLSALGPKPAPGGAACGTALPSTGRAAIPTCAGTVFACSETAASLAFSAPIGSLLLATTRTSGALPLLTPGVPRVRPRASTSCLLAFLASLCAFRCARLIRWRIAFSSARAARMAGDMNAGMFRTLGRGSGCWGLVASPPCACPGLPSRSELLRLFWAARATCLHLCLWMW